MKEPINVDSPIIRITNNIHDMMKDMTENDPDFARYGYNRITFGDPMYLELGDLPLICIDLQTLQNEAKGIGNQSRSDVIYSITVKIVASEKQSGFDWPVFWAMSEKLFEYITARSVHMTTNVFTNETVCSGLNPEIGSATFKYERKFLGATAAAVAAFPVPITIQRHRQKSNNIQRIRR